MISKDTSIWKVIQVLLGAGLGFTSIIGGIVYVITLSIESKHNVEQIAALHKEVDKALLDIQSLIGSVKVTEQTLTEIESEICASYSFRNLMHITDLRNFALLYEQVNHVPYPIGTTFFPECNYKIKRN